VVAYIEGSLDDVKLIVRKLNKHMEWVSLRQTPSKSDGIFKLLESASARPSTGINADGPIGHREDLRNREDGFGSVTALIYPPVKGASSVSPPIQSHSHVSFPSPGYHSSSHGYEGSGIGKLPKLPFPVFDGDNPRHWICRAEITLIYMM
jgi:hypothetical protein